MLTSLKIIRTNAQTFRHVPSAGSPYYISKGHYSMQDEIMTIVEEGKAQRLQVNWRNVSFTDLTGGEVFYASFDELDLKLVEVGYNLAKQQSVVIPSQTTPITFGKFLHFRGLQSLDDQHWYNGDIGAGFLSDGTFIPFGFWNGGTILLSNFTALNNINNWQTSPFDPYV